MRNPVTFGPELLVSLRKRVALLEARKEVLIDLTRTSVEVRTLLQSDPAADISEVLDAREKDCRKLEACSAGEAMEVELLETAAETGDEAGALARAALSLHEDTQTLAQQILQCQSDCEAMLQDRLNAAAHALRESIQRRKLDAAYGPAHEHSNPMYLDKQQ